jgi:osmotically-inducible protein OsmY
MLPSQDHTGKSTTYPSSAGWQNICDNNYHRTSYQKVNYEYASLVESAATKQQMAKLARQVNGVTDVINNLHMQAGS